MFNIANGLGVFNLGISDAVLVLEKRGKRSARDVAVFIERRGQHCPPVLPEPGGVICTTAEE
jgi:hypothetical protein